MENSFFAMMSRMKYINRWALMRNSYTENISEHSLEVSMISHALAIIGNKRFNSSLNVERAAVIAMYHDATEIMTGDMPTPVKYLNSDIKGAYKNIENAAAEKLLSKLPEDLQAEYRSIFFMDKDEEYIWKLVKAADKISALIKCIEEEKAGNREFRNAGETLRNSIVDMHIKEADVFMQELLPCYELTLDELNELE